MKHALPRSTTDLPGLRAARWSRESTGGQFDRYGPDAQREQQDRAIERYGLVDSGLSWSVAHSGRTVDRTGEWADMVARAGVDYDVLVVGYVSRFARDLRTAVNARHDLHVAGAALLFADERVLSSDEESWELWAREAVEAEAYSRRLGKRIREGYAAKFRRLADPGGNAPLGFVRSGQARTLTIDPDTIGDVVALFRRYATGVMSVEQVAREARMNLGAVHAILKNPIYNGWVQRKGERQPAPWRANPPVDDMLWERVQGLRERRTRGGGPKVPGRVDLLAGLLRCTCGASIVANGTGRHGQRRRAHLGWCDEWPAQRTWPSATWEAPIAAQMAGIRHDEATIAGIIAAMQEPDQRPPSIDAGRIERMRRTLALDMAAGRISEAEFLAGIAALREEAPAPQAPAVDAARVTAYLTDVADTWRQLTAEERAGIVAATYEQITVRGDEFVSVRLTADAYANGLALALPERVAARSELVSPEGLEPSTR